MIVHSVYGVQEEDRTIRVPEGAAGRFLELGKLKVSYPDEHRRDHVGFDRSFRVVFRGGGRERAPGDAGRGCGPRTPPRTRYASLLGEGRPTVPNVARAARRGAAAAAGGPRGLTLASASRAGSLAGCSPPEAERLEAGGRSRKAVPGDRGLDLEIRETDRGPRGSGRREGGPRLPAHAEGPRRPYARSNYVHPLMSLDGDVLTEDFPEAPAPAGRLLGLAPPGTGTSRSATAGPGGLHHRAWIGSRHRLSEAAAGLEAEVQWRSPRFREGEPFLEENTTSPSIPRRRRTGHRLRDRPAGGGSGIRIGGSEDPKGYGGFSARVRMPDGLVFPGEAGAVTPEACRSRPAMGGPVGAYGGGGERSGVSHPRPPELAGVPQPWILRQKQHADPLSPGGSRRVPAG